MATILAVIVVTHFVSGCATTTNTRIADGWILSVEYGGEYWVSLSVSNIKSLESNQISLLWNDDGFVILDSVDVNRIGRYDLEIVNDTAFFFVTHPIDNDLESNESSLIIGFVDLVSGIGSVRVDRSYDYDSVPFGFGSVISNGKLLVSEIPRDRTLRLYNILQFDARNNSVVDLDANGLYPAYSNGEVVYLDAASDSIKFIGNQNMSVYVSAVDGSYGIVASDDISDMLILMREKESSTDLIVIDPRSHSLYSIIEEGSILRADMLECGQDIKLYYTRYVDSSVSSVVRTFRQGHQIDVTNVHYDGVVIGYDGIKCVEYLNDM